MARKGIIIGLLIVAIIIIIAIVGVVYYYTRAPEIKEGSGDTGDSSDTETSDNTREREIENALAETYGIHPANSCPSGTCMYGIVRATGSTCRAIGGSMNGTPRDDAWTDCHVNFGRKAPRGFLPPGSCPSGQCHYGAVWMTGADCRAVGGAMNGEPEDSEQTLCHFNFGAKPRYGVYAPGACPTGTCRAVRVNALAEQCRAIGGTTDATSGWGTCTLGFGDA